MDFKNLHENKGLIGFFSTNILRSPSYAEWHAWMCAGGQLTAGEGL